MLQHAPLTTATQLTVAIVLMSAPTTHIMNTTMPIPHTPTRLALFMQPAPQTAKMADLYVTSIIR